MESFFKKYIIKRNLDIKVNITQILLTKIKKNLRF